MSLQIACSADSRLAADCAVMLTSLVATNQALSPTVHFLHDERISPADLAQLGTIVSASGATWHAHRVEDAMTGVFPPSDRYGYSAWYRILLPEVLPDVDRVLYLDSDLLIRGSLAPVWEADLGAGNCLAAVTQPTLPSVLPRLQETLGLPDAGSYFNSGVMLLDLERVRAGGYMDQVLAFIRDGRGPMPWADQDPLNAVLHARRLPLAPRWNAMTPIFDLPPTKLPYTEAETREARADPAVIHFIGPYKPWHFLGRHPYRHEYFTLLESTPWRGRPIEGRTARTMAIGAWPRRWQPHVEGAVNRALAAARRRWQ